MVFHHFVLLVILSTSMYPVVDVSKVAPHHHYYQSLSDINLHSEFGSSSQKSQSTTNTNVITSTKKLGVWSLAILTFYSVNGGPFGMEGIVGAGGPLYALVGFLLLFVWALPEALVTAELSAALPDSSGSVAWVETAFGSYWAFQKGWLSWLSGVSGIYIYI